MTEPLRWKKLLPELSKMAKNGDRCECGHLRKNHLHARQKCLVVVHPKAFNNHRYCHCSEFRAPK